MNIPIEEAPGCAPQGDGEISMKHRFSLLTTERFYSKESDETEALKALGFGFSGIGSPHAVVKTANPTAPHYIESISDLMNFIAKHGTVAITSAHELIILGGSNHYLPRLTECGQPAEGYTSLKQ